MSRPECEDCIFYDPYPCACMCRHYDEYVERITRCEHRTTKGGERINDAHDPLVMERIARWNELIFDGEIRGRHNSLYNPEGIILWGDGTMHDPVTKKTICADGTVIEDDHWGGNMENRRLFEESMEHLKRKTNKKPEVELEKEEPSKQYQTYLPRCDCGIGVLIKDGKLYCRWCRAPYGEGALIDYKDSHFKQK